jgi:hypothetical protein
LRLAVSDETISDTTLNLGAREIVPAGRKAIAKR